MRRFLIACVVCTAFLGGSALLVGCVSAEAYAQAQADAERLAGDIETREADLAALTAQLEAAVAANDPQTVESLVSAINEITSANTADNAALADALGTMKKGDAGWDFAQMAVGALSIFVPGAGVAVPMIGRARKRFEGSVEDFNGLVAAISAGGGPKDQQATREAMKHYPGLKERVTTRRVEIGDKVIQAVRATESTA